ncbi:MAG: PIN domain-containing protein, partial [Bacteroidales bacterium]|nr:PIN domain-containing protein [Bacteroidales bacterium]
IKSLSPTRSIYNYMARYFLDTHIVVWLITDDHKLDESLKNEIKYPSAKDKYVTSEFVILELMHLKQLKKIDYKGTAKNLIESLASFGINLEPISTKVFETLEKLPILTIEKKAHTDMIDRIIIAQSIECNCTCISHDHKFPYYRKYDLKLLEA